MSNKNQTNRHLKQRRIEAGLCPSCATRSIEQGKNACRRCLDLANERRKLKYASKKNSTICMLCLTNQRHEGYSMCHWCIKYQTTYRLNLKLEIFDAYGGAKCACPQCPLSLDTNHQFLSIDHIHDGGRRQNKRGTNLYLWLRTHQYPSGYRVLCHNCNCGRQINNGICPHIDNTPNGTTRGSRQLAKLRLEAMDTYGGRYCACTNCPEHTHQHLKFLTIDHTSNNGNEHRRQFGRNFSSLRLLRWLKQSNWPPGYQILCFNCNIARSFNDGICPHMIN